MLRAGSLRESITLQSVSYTIDDYHEQSATWADVATVKASVVPVATSEAIAAQRPEVQQVLRIAIRYRDGLTVKNRIKHVQGSSTRYYEILSITNRGLRDRVLDIEAAYLQE